jgi:hypothetical protein
MKTKNLLMVSTIVNIALVCGVIFLLKQFLCLPDSTPPAVFITRVGFATNVPTAPILNSPQHPN